MTTNLKSFENVYGSYLVVHCRSCGKETRKDVAGLAERLGWDHVVWDGLRYRLPLKCSCGARNYSITVDRETELKNDTSP